MQARPPFPWEALFPASVQIVIRKSWVRNEKIRIGVIGVNSRGNALAQGFAKMKGCEVTYLCDVDSRALERCQADIHKISGRTPKGEKDIRKMLESDDFEAVVIATPDHLACQSSHYGYASRKHVYLEKPTSHNPAENEMLVRATLKYNRIVQVGNQRRSWPNVIKAIEEIKSGAIGKVRYAKSWYVNNRPSIGTGKVVPVPIYRDWDYGKVLHHGCPILKTIISIITGTGSGTGVPVKH